MNFEKSDLCGIGAMKGVEGAFCGVKLYISYMNQVPPHIIEELKKITLHLFGRAKNQKLSILHLLETLHLVAIRT